MSLRVHAQISLHEFLEHHLDGLSLEEIGVIYLAWHTACAQLKGLNMRSGGQAIEHAMMVAHLARLMGLSIEAIAAAMVHDVIEDTQSDFTLDELEAAFGKFGPRIRFIVAALTKTKGMSDEEYFDQVYQAAKTDPEVAIIKALDRYDGQQRPYDKPDAPNYVVRARAYYQETIGPFFQLCLLCRPFVSKKHLSPSDERPGYDEIVSATQLKAREHLAELDALPVAS